MLDITICTESNGFEWEDLPVCIGVLVHEYVCAAQGVNGSWQHFLKNLISLAKSECMGWS